MGIKNEKLAGALKALRRLQDKHSGVVESEDLSEAHRAILVETGFLHQVTKGWYICANPKDGPGDSTAWYASFWAFLSGYLSKRFGKRYCLNAESSLLLQTGSTTVPRQVIAIAKETGNQVLTLPFNTSLMVYQDEKRVPRTRVEIKGLQVFPLPEALCRIAPGFFIPNSQEIEIALAQIRDVSELLTTLLVGEGMGAAAGRLAGALKQVAREDEANRIIQAMEAAGRKVPRINPFEELADFVPTLSATRERSPYVLRLKSMWAGWRDVVLSVFPQAPGFPADVNVYLRQVQDRYVADAYNSLSIEGYQVTDDLIERVAKAGWDPDNRPEDKESRNAMAARGYFQAFQEVRETISRVLNGEPAGKAVQRDHHEWYRELFAPAVTLGIIEKHHLAGYRTGPVFIRNSLHTPLPQGALIDTMEALFGLISEESEASVRAVLGHHLFVFIHPYFDGNGRMGRFLLNVMLASGGYPWTVVRMKCRDAYMAALEEASVRGNIRPLAEFLRAEMMGWNPENIGANDY